MKVNIDWLEELVDLKISLEELAKLLPLKSIATREVNERFIELDMKGYNRSDLLSLRGVALEVAAIADTQIKFDNDGDPKIDRSLPKLKVEIEDRALCPLYCLVKIEDLKVEKSPSNLIKKLEDSGLRSINNIADITNLVMLEFGQPLHAFDARVVKEETIIVRKAIKGERITTLDGKTRDLETSDLLIADPQNNLGIAGVMGGKDSEITDSTSSILLEAAIFDPKTLRKTSTKLGINSEAGKRFYHGLTKKRLFQALERALEAYRELGGKITALTIEDNLAEKETSVELSKQKIDSLIGVAISEEDIEVFLKKLYFKLDKKREGVWEVRIPYWRGDISIEEDLVEEVARMYGYEKIPAKSLPGEIPKVQKTFYDSINDLKQALVEVGLTEVQTYSFYSTEVLNNIGWAPDNLDRLVKVANPMSAETQYLRLVLWQNLVEAAAKNYKKGFEDIAIFEVGKMYDANSDSGPKEGYDLSIALINSSENPAEELYSLFQKAMDNLGIKVEKGDKDRTLVDDMLFHPTRFIHLSKKGKSIGGIAEIHPRIINKFGLEKRVGIIEINLENMLS